MSEPTSEQSIFLHALALTTSGARAAYLDEACRDKPGLRAELDALLAAHDRLGNIPPAANPPSPLGGAGPGVRGLGPTVDTPGPEAPGVVLAGKYKLLEEIGEGGMGTVWMAQQLEPVKRLVAIKLIKAGMDSKQVIARFEAERQALALMDHPNIAKVLDGGMTGERRDGSPPVLGGDHRRADPPSADALAGRPFFVMELVKGQPITKYCDEHHLTPKERLELFMPVCQAIQHAHQKGIIHRDLKPSNVLVALYDGKPVPKVIDFGVAKAAGQPLTEQTLVTGFGNIVGTLEYMSPEQAELNNQDIDTRSDIYSLGVLLYELLTGTTPLEHKRVKQQGILESLRIIREEETPTLSHRLSSTEELPAIAASRGTEPAKLTKLVRGELDWIVMKALAKDRSRRYETANGFAMDVQRYLADEPVLAGPPSAWYRFRKFAQRNKGRVAVAAGVSLAALVMIASIGWVLGDRAARQAEMEGRAREGFEVARTLIAENKLIAAREKLAAARAQLGNNPSALAGLAAEVEAAEDVLDRLQQFLGLIDRAHQAETAPVLEPTLAGHGSPGRAATTPPPATRWGRRPAAAVPFLLKALDCYAVLERDDWSVALEGGLLGSDQVEQVRRTVYDELLWLAADLADRQQEHRSGKKLTQEAAARAAIVYLGKAETVLSPTQALYLLRARCRKALGEEAAAQADRQLADKTPPTLAVDHYLRGMAAYEANQLADGIQAFEAALELEPTHYWSLMWLGSCLCDLGRGPEDFAGAARVFVGCILKRPDHAHAYRCRGLSYYKLAQYHKAVADYSKAIDLDPKFAYAWMNRGDASGMLGQHEKALADYSRAIDLDPNYPGAWNSRGVVYCDHLGQYDKAVADFSRTVELNPKLAEAWHNRAVAYRNLHRYEEAVVDYSKAIDLDPKCVSAWYNRGLAYDDRGQHEKAVADYSRALELDPKHTDAWNSRGVVYCDHLGQPAKAVADFSRAIELDPKHVIAWYNRAVAYNGLRQYDEAVADYSKAIDLDPKRVSAWYNRGVIYCDHLGQPAKAVADLSSAIDLDPKYTNAWCSRGIAYDKWGRYVEAVADFSRAIKLDPKLVSAWYGRGIAYVTLGRYDEAVADYSSAIKLDPKHANACYGRGLAYRKLGRYVEAVADYKTVLKLAPAHARAHSSLAWVLATCPDANLRDPGRAVELAKEAVRLAPKIGMNWNTLGLAHYRAGDCKAAVAALDKSVELRRGGDAFDWFFLAMAYRKLGKDEEPREAYRKAMRWLEENEATLAKNKELAEVLRRFRSEAEEVLEMKKK